MSRPLSAKAQQAVEAFARCNNELEACKAVGYSAPHQAAYRIFGKDDSGGFADERVTLELERLRETMDDEPEPGSDEHLAELSHEGLLRELWQRAFDPKLPASVQQRYLGELRHALRERDGRVELERGEDCPTCGRYWAGDAEEEETAMRQAVERTQKLLRALG